VLSQAPRVQYHSCFVSDEDVNALVALADARPDAWLDGGTGAPREYSFSFLPPLQRFFHDAVRTLEARVAAATGVAPHAGEDPLKLSRHRPADDACPLLNLHVDANAARPRRFATLILYLSDARGGGTFFPCASASAASCDTSAAVPDGQPGHSLRSALHALHGAGVCMLPATPDAAGSEAEEAALAGASALCARLAAEQDATGAPWVAGDDGGLLVAPRRGAALIFWSGADAWHGAAAVLGGEKLAVQKFKETAPAAPDGGECDARA
jgi:hypothetical protein